MASELLTAEDICNRALLELGEDFINAISDLSNPTTKEEKACALVYAPLRDQLQQDYVWRFLKDRVKIERDDNDRHTLLQADGGWTVSGVATEYYLPISNKKSFKSKPDDVWEDDTAMTEGTLGSLAAGEWAWGDNDSIGRPTIYVRLSDSTDPDTKYAADNDYLEARYDDPTHEWDFALPFPADTLNIRVVGENSFGRQEWSNRDDDVLNFSGPQEPSWEIEADRFLYFESEVFLLYTKRITEPEKFDNWFTDALIYFIASRICISLTANRALRNDMVALFDATIDTGKKNNALQANMRREKTLTTHRPLSSWARRGRSGSGLGRS
jgi:hypothetical protein